VRQQPIPVIYERVRIDTGFRADLIVEDKVIVLGLPIRKAAKTTKNLDKLRALPGRDTVGHRKGGLCDQTHPADARRTRAPQLR
jgi:hypothetical protein